MTDYGHVTPELLGRIREVIAESVRHTYSVSRVYAAYNAAMGKNEKPQTCGSCLQRRVRELKRWLADYERLAGAMSGPSLAVEHYELKDGGRVTIAGGKVKNEEGKGLVAGKYPTEDGGRLVVAPGSRGRYEAPTTGEGLIENENEKGEGQRENDSMTEEDNDAQERGTAVETEDEAREG